MRRLFAKPVVVHTGPQPAMCARIHPDSLDYSKITFELHRRRVAGPNSGPIWHRTIIRTTLAIATKDRPVENPFYFDQVPSEVTRNDAGEVTAWITWTAIEALGLKFTHDKWENLSLLRPPTVAEIREDRCHQWRWRIGYAAADAYKWVRQQKLHPQFGAAVAL